MELVTLEDFIRSKAPKGTPDEVIEKGVATITRAAIRGLGKLGEKLKGVIGRVVQFFRGEPGVWITQGGKKVFIKVDPKGLTGVTPAQAAGLKRLNKKGTALQRRWDKGFKSAKETADFADGVISGLQDFVSLL